MIDFEWDALDYSKKNACWLARLSLIAYEPFPDSGQPMAAMQTWGLDDTDFHYFDVGSTQAFTAGNGRGLLLAFRGTTTLGDWVTDLTAVPQPLTSLSDNTGMVHAGFYQALMSIWDDLWDFIQEQRRNRPLWVIGHSLGGALALLATAKLKVSHDILVNGLYTFGQPRVGNGNFASFFNGQFGHRAFRYVNHLDIVPRVPTPPLYRHTDTFHYFDSDRNQINDRGQLNEIEGQIEWSPLHSLGANATDHSMSTYVARTQRALLPAIILQIDYNPPGRDVSTRGEHVVISSQSTGDLDMTGWTLRDAIGATFTFPSFRLRPEASVCVWTGNGTHTDRDLYWGRGRAVWNNKPGDTAILCNPEGIEVDRYSYPPVV